MRPILTCCLLVSLAHAEDIPALIERLAGGDPKAADRIAELGPEAGAAVPELVRAARSARPEIRWRAVWALGRIGPQASEAAALVGRALDDADDVVQAAALAALPRLGPAATGPIIEAIGRSTQRYDADRRLKLLANFEPNAELALTGLIDLYERGRYRGKGRFGKWSIRIDLLEEIERMAVLAPGPFLKIVEADRYWSWAALVAIGQPSVPLMVKIATDPTRKTAERRGARSVLAGIGSRWDVVREAFDDWPDLKTANGLLYALRYQPGKVNELLPRIEPILARGPLTQSEEWRYHSILLALIKLEKPGHEALLRLLTSKKRRVRVEALKAIRTLEDASLYIPTIVKAIDADRAEERQAAMATLYESPPSGRWAREAAKRAVPYLESDIKESRYEAARLLGVVGYAAKPYRRRILRASKDRDIAVRAVAYAALCNLRYDKVGVIGGIVGREDLEEETWRKALHGLVMVGPKAASEYHGFLKALASGRPSNEIAAEALARLVPHLEEEALADVMLHIDKAARGPGIDGGDRFIEELRRQGRAKALGVLLTHLYYRSDCAEALAALPNQARPVVLALTEHPDKLVRSEAARILVTIDGAECETRFIELTLGPDALIPKWAEAGYRAAWPKAKPIVLAATRSTDWEQRYAAVKWLHHAARNDVGAIAALRVIVRTETTSPFERAHALTALNAVLGR